MSRKNIVISSINFFEGGPLSVLKDCLTFLNESDYLNQYQFIALVHKKELFSQEGYNNIKFVEFPKSRTSYFYRLYYEYVYFKKFAKQHSISFWLSLHDITPNIGKVPQAVYCHNPSPFNAVNISDFRIQPTQFFFSLFYKYLYKINIKRNKYVIVQQLWIKEKFHEFFGIQEDKIIISIPQLAAIPTPFMNAVQPMKKKQFFFPTFPRPFKNIEVIAEAVKILNVETTEGFEVLITIDGSENKYAQSMLDKYKQVFNIKFIGLVTRNQVYQLYDEVDFLIFPSKLETWGLPISEFKRFNKPMLVSNLPYAKETVGEYKKVIFFEANSAADLAKGMKKLINGENSAYSITASIVYPKPFAKSWAELFDILLN
jgi:glycosyltransferase involved in cell wall biosynthesis